MTFGACWTCDADATGANALDGRAAEETGGVDGGSTGSTVRVMGRNWTPPGGRKDCRGGGHRAW